MAVGSVQRVILVVLLMNVAVAVAKAIYGHLSGSLSVASDAIHSLLDATANVIGLFFLRLATTPPDREHPYGHRKIETMAATFIGFLIAGGALSFGMSAVEELAHGRHALEAGVGGFVVMAGTLLVNLFVTRYEHRRGKELGSAFLVADAAHTMSDVFVTIAVIVALAGSRLGLGILDPLVALGVIVVIMRVAWRIIAANVGVLLDRAVMDAGAVRETVLSVPGVVGCHRVRSRGVEGAVLVDFHLLVDGGLPLREAHALSHQVEAKVKAAYPQVVDVTIHIEPEEDEEEDL